MKVRQQHRYHLPARGFTLMEMVLSVVVLAILAGILAPMFANVLSASASSAASFSTLADVSMAMQRMMREIRQADYNAGAYQCDIMASTSLRCVKNDSAQTQFYLNYNANSINLAYSVPNASANLLANVSSFQLRYLDSSGAVTGDPARLAQVEISLSVDSANMSNILSLRSRVMLRDRG